MANPALLWNPSEDRVARATITRYQEWLDRERGLRFADYDELWRWSADDLEGFWRSIGDCFGIRFAVASDRVLDGLAMPGTKWFPGSRISYAEHIFRAAAGGRDADAVAIHHVSELGPLDTWTW